MRGIVAATLAALGTGAALAAPAGAAVTSTVGGGGNLEIVGDGADDTIVVTCSLGNVKINGADPGTGVAACSSITSLYSNANGGNDATDTTGVLPSDFIRLQDAQEIPFNGISRAFGNVQVDTAGGNPGNDTIRGGPFGEVLGNLAAIEPGTKTITGGGGPDGIVAVGPGGNNSVDAGAGNDVVDIADGVAHLGAGNDVVTNLARATVFGDDGNDFIGYQGRFGDARRSLGKPGNLRLFGGAGNDKIVGLQGKDKISGDDGNDKLAGAKGNDKLTGGKGKDKFFGGPGHDRCVGGAKHDSQAKLPSFELDSYASESEFIGLIIKAFTKFYGGTCENVSGIP